jgi:hypothetical protein
MTDFSSSAKSWWASAAGKAEKAKRQPELALNQHGEGEQPEASAAPKRRGRPPKARGADSLN